MDNPVLNGTFGRTGDSINPKLIQFNISYYAEV